MTLQHLFRSIRKSSLYANNFLGIYKLPYVLARRKAKPVANPEYDIVFVIPEHGGGWILQGISQEIATRYRGRTKIVFSNEEIPYARKYFLMHYSLSSWFFLNFGHYRDSEILVLYTHLKDLPYTENELIYLFNSCDRVICMNSTDKRFLREKCGSKLNIDFLPMGVDQDIFKPSKRGGGVVGFCCAFYERKSPDRILEIIKAMPHRQFILLGPGWEKFRGYQEMLALPNFQHYTVPYAEYPEYYTQMDIFVSASRLEGGPIPLLEAMMSNCVPVSSNTGFAPDVIEHGRNGYIFNQDASVKEICELIDKADLISIDISETVKAYTWSEYVSFIDQ